MSEKIILAGDIGATKSNLSFYSSKGGLNNPIAETTLQNKDFDNFEQLIESIIDPAELNIDGICLGIAGPVVDNQVHITNLPWVIDGNDLQKKYNLQGVWLLNDLEALCYAVPNLLDEEVEVIRLGSEVEGAPIAVIAPGTGLGEGFLTWDGYRYRANSSEGGHTDFGPINDKQIHLLKYMRKNQKRVSYENVCSGIGIPNLYRFLRDEGYAEETDWLEKELKAGDDLTPVIFDTALDETKDNLLCQLTVELFVEILGAEAGNLALKTLSKGCIYIGGGLPPRILPWLKKDGFLQALSSKDPHSELLSKIPVKVILNIQANLIGAADYGLKELSK
jgi:glucokinase